MSSSTPYLRPMSLGNILDYTFKTYRRYFVVIALFSLLVAGIFSAFGFILIESVSSYPILQNPIQTYMEMFSGEFMTLDPYMDLENPAMFFDMMVAMIFLYGVLGFTALFITPFVQGGITVISERFLIARDVDIAWAFKNTWRKYGRLILTTICIGIYNIVIWMGLGIVFTVLMIPAGFMMAFVGSMGTGGIIVVVIIMIIGILAVLAAITALYAFISLTYAVVMFEDKFHFDAIVRSFKLIGRSFFKTMGVTVLIYLLSAIIGGSIIIAMNLITMWAGVPGFLSYILQSIITILVAPIVYIAFALLYFDIRIRTEGYDLEYAASNTEAVEALT